MDRIELSPGATLERLAGVIPPDLREHITIVGSVAAAYALFPRDRALGVRTKDVDCVLVPGTAAVAAGQQIVHALLAMGWRQFATDEFPRAGTAETPLARLPLIRLSPQGEPDWFVEFLTEPPAGHQGGRHWERIVLGASAHFGIPGFEFTAVATHDAQRSHVGFRYARPELMALAHLLEHRAFGDALFGGTEGSPLRLYRRNKDLGRAIAIAHLSGPLDHPEWVDTAIEALKQVFPDRWRELARSSGAGLRKLLASPWDIAQATQIANNSLLARYLVTPAQFAESGSMFDVTFVEGLEGRAEFGS